MPRTFLFLDSVLDAVALLWRKSTRKTTAVDPDRALLVRARAALDQTLERSHDVQLRAEHGRITLFGTVSADDRKKALEALRADEGIAQLEDQLRVTHAA